MPRTRTKIAWFLAAGVLAFALACVSAGVPGTAAQSSSHDAGPGSDWPFYGHDAGGTRYSPLAQINRKNVANLKVAWTFHVGDISDGSGGRKRTGLETTPILVDGTLYLTSGFNRVFALDPETGAQRWVYDPQIDTAGRYGDGLINRGVAASRRGSIPRARRNSPAAGESSKPLWTRGSSRSTAPLANRAPISATPDK